MTKEDDLASGHVLGRRTGAEDRHLARREVEIFDARVEKTGRAVGGEDDTAPVGQGRRPAVERARHRGVRLGQAFGRATFLEMRQRPLFQLGVK